MKRLGSRGRGKSEMGWGLVGITLAASRPDASIKGETRPWHSRCASGRDEMCIKSRHVVWINAAL